MSTVAEQLRQAREAQHLTIEQVAEITKIRTDHLRALEEGDFNAFSAPVYIRGFVRTYAGVLKLDVAGTIKDLDAELGQTKKFAEPPSLSGEPKSWLDVVMLQLSKIDWRKGVLAVALVLGAAMLVGAALWWRHYRTANPLAGVKPALYQPTQHISGDTLPLPPQRR